MPPPSSDPIRANPPAAAVPPVARDDMDDGPELQDPAMAPVLRAALAAIAEILLPVYSAADQHAIRSQRRHRLITTLAAATGTVAVLFGIGELASHSLGAEMRRWMVHVEALFLLACLASVVLGLTAALQTGWLDERHRAERCRSLKFRLLARPELWGGRLGEWRAMLRAEVAAIAAAPSGTAKAAAHSDPELDPPPENPGGAVAPAELRVLADYYLAKRLRFQRQFYASRVARNDERDRRLRRLPPLCFFLSVAAALGNYLLGMFQSGPPHHGAELTTVETLGLLLLVFSAAVPVVGAGIRTYRMAYEFARSASLFQAKIHALDHFEQLLQHDLAAPAPEGATVLRRLWQCENFFEHEHHEWLRLMLEAEWFG